MGKTPSYDANHATDYLKKAIPEPPYKAIAQSEIPKFIASLKDTANFQPNALEHILNGNFNRRGSAGGFHTESFNNSAGKVINGTRTLTDKLGLYQGQVEVNGVLKSGNKGYSTFFPKDWSPQRIVDEINHAYQNRNLIEGMRYSGKGTTGITIELILDSNKKIISGYPSQTP